MKAHFDVGSVTFTREEGDKRRYHGTVHASGEHTLFHNLAKWLNARGFNVIKKRAQKDGHMVGDEYQPYIRCAQPSGRKSVPKGIPHIAIISGFYALRGANEDWNKGSVELNLHTDFFRQGQDTFAMIAALCDQHPDMTISDRARNVKPHQETSGEFINKLMEDFAPAK